MGTWMKLFAVLALIAVPFSSPAQDYSDFHTFLSSFKSAVHQRNTHKLRDMMSNRFDFMQATNVTPRAVFQGLDADNGRQWENLQQAVLGSVETYEGSGPYSHSQILQCTPLQQAVSCIVVFQLNGQKHWRWRAMVMPTR